MGPWARTCKECCNGVPALSHVLGSREDEAFEGGVEGVDAMVEELAERSALVGSSPVSRASEILAFYSYHFI